MSGWVDGLREHARRALPVVEGDLKLGGLREPVTVIRDRWGVPHISAENDDDVYFAQGFVTASERLFQIDLTMRYASGRLAGMLGELALPLDRFARTVGWNRAASCVATTFDDRSRAMVQAWGAGVRAWAQNMPARPVEYEVLDLQPDVPAADVVEERVASAAVFIAWNLSGNWDAELLRMEVAERLGPRGAEDLFPGFTPPDEVDTTGLRALDLLRDAPTPRRGQGSNNWVVAGSRSETGAPLLANDPHLTSGMPPIWFECHLTTPSFDVSGVALPFSPGIVIGRTARIAWGTTNVSGDTQDLYLERLTNDGTAALYDGESEPLTLHREEIDVRGRPEPEILEVRETRHGPLLDSYLLGSGRPEVVEGGIHRTVALRWVGAEHAVQPSALHAMALANDAAEFREAIRGWECPGQNFVYADVEGVIGYQSTGLFPIRRAGHDGMVPVPGWSSEAEWDGWIAFEQLPRDTDPDTGFLATANQRIQSEDDEHQIGYDYSPPFRAHRIEELLSHKRAHGADSFARMQTDTLSPPALLLVAFLIGVEPRGERQERAIAELRSWNAELSPDSAAAAIYEVWCVHIAKEILLPRLGPELFDHYYARRSSTNPFRAEVLPRLLADASPDWFGGEGVDARDARDARLRNALDAALDELTASLGEDMGAWRWGSLHHARFTGPIAISPDLAELFTGADVEIGGDEQTVLQSSYLAGESYRATVIPSWRQIVDLSDPDAALAVLPTGQSGNPESPHWNDQAELWSGGRLHPLPFTRAAVEREAEATLRLLPG
ncbi:MAG: penicillin acylase family protein [Actinomycetota bacterium]|nr:penicillin acylase family protein [Actinomycetota bacterium]